MCFVAVDKMSSKLFETSRLGSDHVPGDFTPPLSLSPTSDGMSPRTRVQGGPGLNSVRDFRTPGYVAKVWQEENLNEKNCCLLLFKLAFLSGYSKKK